MFSGKPTRAIAAGAAAIAIAGGAYGIAGTASGNSSVAAATTANPPKTGGARSGPAAGGAVGTVGSVSTSSFTLTTSAGQKVTVAESSSTKYVKGTTSTTSSAVAKGAPVLVVGTVNGKTITATQVIVQPTGISKSSSVVPFKRGAPSAAKQVGKIPSNYVQGSGTIVSGTAATKATEAALASYPGGIVDRVVKLSNGEYEVHNIGVNWPHHIFVDASFKVVGAN
jgi:hypothetical protein